MVNGLLNLGFMYGQTETYTFRQIYSRVAIAPYTETPYSTISLLHFPCLSLSLLLPPPLALPPPPVPLSLSQSVSEAVYQMEPASVFTALPLSV
jgi:hypothetical protein